MQTKKRILSGVQPTGDLHIGNWLGAINNWVTLQEEYETFLCVVDLHAITAAYNPKELSKNTLSTAALYVACGIDPKICSIFVQSQISAHSELCWILNCMTPINWMERMIQFKEKSIQQGIMYPLDYLTIRSLWLQTFFYMMLTSSQSGKIKNNILNLPEILHNRELMPNLVRIKIY